MITPTQDKALERWDLLPLSLREALFAESTADFLEKTCQDEHVPQEKIKIVSQIAGYVLLGFIHPEDVAGEIKERLNLDQRTAIDIQNALNQRIFTPLRADIDKAYQPLSKLEPASAGPAILNDINISVKSSVPVASATSQTLTVSPSLKSAAIPNNNIVPNAPKPNRLSDVGWSRSRTADPVVKLDVSQPQKIASAAPAPAPAPQRPQSVAPQPNASATAAGAGANRTLGEFERLKAMKNPSVSSAATPTAPAPKPSPAEPAPFMLHEDTSFKAQTKNNDFSLPRPDANAQAKMSAIRPQAPLKPAVLEFGTGNNPAPKPPAGPSKTVHYTEFTASLSSAPTANSGPRTVGQIMPAPPSATVPMPPRPPQPPMPQKEQVIVKDFL